MRFSISYILFFQLLFTVSLPICYSCGVKPMSSDSAVVIANEPQLLFLNYSIQKGVSGKIDVSFINKVVTDGRLKDTSNKKPLSDIGDLECIQYDKNNEAMETTYVKNPLKLIVESVNDSGELEKKQIQLDSAQFSVKLQLDKETRFITLSQINAVGEAKTTLITTKIN